jgi:Fuc2NAc and GlcNAc transferase
MGDVGSGFLGYAFGVLALAANNAGALPIPFWLVLLGVFVFDATVTVARRALVGERVTAPHRLHAYQRLVQVGWSHRQVTSAVIGVNLVLAGLVWLARTRELPTAGLAAGGLVILAGLYLAVERLAPFGQFRNQRSPNRYK